MFNLNFWDDSILVTYIHYREDLDKSTFLLNNLKILLYYIVYL
jgi:hypothetical protein